MVSAGLIFAGWALKIVFVHLLELSPQRANLADASENSQRSNEISGYAALKFVHNADDLMLSCVAAATKSAAWEDGMLLWTAIFWLGCAAIFLDMAERAPALD